MKADVVEAAKELSTKYGAMSNVYRTMIAAFLQKKGEASWSEIKAFIEGYMGSVNPNTLHFHLKALVDEDIIKRKGSEDRSSYTIGDLPEFIAQSIGEKILPKMRR